MITPFRILIAYALQVIIGTAAPVGICLHAYSPQAPAEKIECFEFEKVERAGADYRFFPRADKSVVVTAYRFRGTILYKPDLAPTHPDFDKQLKIYETTARATPSTRAFLNPKILAMRSQSAAVAKQAESVAALPAITLPDGSKLVGCTVSKIEGGFVSVRHQNGVRKISLKELDATEKKALNSTTDEWSLDEPSVTLKDSTGTFAKIVFKNGLLLKKAKFKEIAEGNLVFIADGKSVSVPADQFPGELSVLGEEVVKTLSPVKEEANPKPAVASSSGHDSPMPAEQGDASAQFDMGMKYAKGEGVGQDDAEAVKWFRKAADKGLADAQVILGQYYFNGYGVPQDNTQAVKWHRKAAEQGNKDALFYLGNDYYKGIGVLQDKAQAVIWWRRAIIQGSSIAKLGMIGLYHEEGLPQDAIEVAKWLRERAAQGYVDAQYELGLRYQKGNGVPRDIAEAAKWFRKAAELGDAQSQLRLGAYYDDGNAVVPQDKVQAMKWKRKAADQGLIDAQVALIIPFERGEGVPKDPVQACKWAMLTAPLGSPGAKHSLQRFQSELSPEQLAKAKKMAQEWKLDYSGSQN